MHQKFGRTMALRVASCCAAVTIYGCGAAAGDAPSSEMTSSIIHGTDIGEGSENTHAAVQLFNAWGRCSANLLNDHWVITASHCTQPGEVEVRYENPIGTWVNGKVDRVIEYADDDLALIKLAEPLENASGVSFQLYTGDFDELKSQDDVYAVCDGYGINHVDGWREDSPDQLRTATVRITDFDGVMRPPTYDDANKVYALPGWSGQIAASGDSGSTCFVDHDGTLEMIGPFETSRGPEPDEPDETKELFWWARYTGSNEVRDWVNSQID